MTGSTCRKCHRVAKYRGLCTPHHNAVGVHGYVPAGPVRHRVELLRGNGWTLGALEQRTGLTRKTLLCRTQRAQATTTQAVMAIPLSPPSRSTAKLVAAVGARRRAQALVALGWPQTAIAARAGLPHMVVNRLVVGNGAQVTSATATAITEAFTALAMTPGPSGRARSHAQRRGWPPPLAWDNIDDPTATPDTGFTRPVTFAERFTELRDHVGIRNEERIAEILGITTESVADQCYRNKLRRVL